MRGIILEVIISTLDNIDCNCFPRSVPIKAWSSSITIYFNETQINSNYQKMYEDIMNYNNEINEDKKYMF